MERSKGEMVIAHDKLVASLHHQINSASHERYEEVNQSLASTSNKMLRLETAFQEASKKNGEYKELLKSSIAKGKKQNSLIAQLTQLGLFIHI